MVYQRGQLIFAQSCGSLPKEGQLEQSAASAMAVFRRLLEVLTGRRRGTLAAKRSSMLPVTPSTATSRN